LRWKAKIEATRNEIAALSAGIQETSIKGDRRLVGTGDTSRSNKWSTYVLSVSGGSRGQLVQQSVGQHGIRIKD
jgi:thiamine monophosphate kinase